MNGRRLAFHGYSLFLPAEWDDLTGDFDEPGQPTTLGSRSELNRLLHISCARYAGGEEPRATLDDLEELLDGKARSSQFEDGFDFVSKPGHVFCAAGSYRYEGMFLRAWYVSDGRNFIFATYLSDWTEQGIDAAVREAIIESIEFDPA